MHIGLVFDSVYYFLPRLPTSSLLSNHFKGTTTLHLFLMLEFYEFVRYTLSSDLYRKYLMRLGQFLYQVVILVYCCIESSAR